MIVLTIAMMLTAVVGFLAGREYDRSIKRINENRRRRREEQRRMADEARANALKDLQEKKDKFIYGVYYDCPRG